MRVRNKATGVVVDVPDGRGEAMLRLGYVSAEAKRPARKKTEPAATPDED